MPKTNAAGEPSYYDAIGTDATATNALGEIHTLDPLVDDEGNERDDLIIDGKGREERERDETERREREEQSEANRTDEQQANLVRDGKSKSNVGEAEGSDHVKDSASAQSKAANRSTPANDKTSQDKGGDQSSDGISSPESSPVRGKNTPSK